VRKQTPDVILTCNYSPWSRYQGGGQKSAHMVACAHAEAGLAVTLLCTKAPWESITVPTGLPYQVAWAGFFALRPGISSPFRFLNALTVARRARDLAGEGTVLHGNGDEAAFLRTVPGARFLYTSRYPAFDDFLYRLPWRHPGRAYLRCFLKEPRFAGQARAIRTAGAATATSSSSARATEAAFGLAEGRVQVVPNGIDPGFLDGEAPVPEGRGVLFYGRLTRAKGCDLLLRAWMALPELLRREHPLTVIGNGPMRSELEQLAAAAGTGGVEFVDWADGAGIRRRLRTARLAALPSLEESFGNTMVETLAMGQELLTTEAGSIPEVCGPWGTRVAPGSAEALRQALEAFLSRPRAGQVEEQRTWFRERYSWTATARRFRELYARL
jgi:glycosyltransferase involved in cell wall biosynthesis